MLINWDEVQNYIEEYEYKFNDSLGRYAHSKHDQSVLTRRMEDHNKLIFYPDFGYDLFIPMVLVYEYA